SVSAGFEVLFGRGAPCERAHDLGAGGDRAAQDVERVEAERSGLGLSVDRGLAGEDLHVERRELVRQERRDGVGGEEAAHGVHVVVVPSLKRGSNISKPAVLGSTPPAVPIRVYSALPAFAPQVGPFVHTGMMLVAGVDTEPE